MAKNFVWLYDRLVQLKLWAKRSQLLAVVKKNWIIQHLDLGLVSKLLFQRIPIGFQGSLARNYGSISHEHPRFPGFLRL